MNIKKLVEDFKLTQKELAALFDCGVANVSNIVNGRRGITPLQVRQLIERFGYDVIAEYADPEELPVKASLVNPVTEPVPSPVTNDPALEEIIKKQTEIIKLQSDALARKDEQISRLLSIMEKFGVEEKK